MNISSFEETGPYFEFKYLVPPSRIEEVSAGLTHYFHAPLKYSSGRVRSYYFDTSDLSEYSRGSDGYTIKQKVRYRILGDLENQMNYCLELKEKRNQSVFKKRIRLSDDLTLQLNDLDHHFNSRKFELGDRFRALCEVPFGRLKPKLLIEYDRARFIYPGSLARASFDSNISSVCLFSSDKLRGPNMFKLGHAILEIKTPTNSILPWFSDILRLKRSAFSKYNYFMSKHLDDLQVMI